MKLTTVIFWTYSSPYEDFAIKNVPDGRVEWKSGGRQTEESILDGNVNCWGRRANYLNECNLPHPPVIENLTAINQIVQIVSTFPVGDSPYCPYLGEIP